MSQREPRTEAGRRLSSRLWATKNYEDCQPIIAFIFEDVRRIEDEAASKAEARIWADLFTEDEITMLLASMAVAQGEDGWPNDEADTKALRSAERKLSGILIDQDSQLLNRTTATEPK
jgi:hypothetical protein